METRLTRSRNHPASGFSPNLRPEGHPADLERILLHASWRPGGESRGQTGRLRSPSCSLLSDWPGEIKGIHPETHVFDLRIKAKEPVLAQPPDLRGARRGGCSGHESAAIKAFAEIKGLVLPEAGEV